jgi:DNA polymerase-1
MSMSRRPGDGGFDFGDGDDDARQAEDRADRQADGPGPLKVLLENPAVLKVGQNIKYDIAVMAKRGVRVAPVDDTMLISYVLEGGLHGHGMDELAKLHLGHEPIAFKSVTGAGKKQISFKHVELGPATCYAAEDADVTLRLWRMLKPRLATEGLITVYETLERHLPGRAGGHGDRGHPGRSRAPAPLSHEFGMKMAELEAKAHELAGRPFNVGSPKQIGDILFGEMGLPGGKKTATGQWGTDASMLEELALTHELPRTMLDWRQLSKLKGTYTDALIAAMDPGTNRVHTSYQMAARPPAAWPPPTPTCRTSRSARDRPPDPPGLHRRARPCADQRRLQPDRTAPAGPHRRHPAAEGAFAAGQDIHASTASEMFGVPIEGMPSRPAAAPRRSTSASSTASAFGLAAQLGIEQSEAGAYIKTYFERFPGIRDYMDKTKAFARENGFVSTIFGRKINIPAIQGKSRPSASSANAPPSTPPSRARRRTSSAGP